MTIWEKYQFHIMWILTRRFSTCDATQDVIWYSPALRCFVCVKICFCQSVNLVNYMSFPVKQQKQLHSQQLGCSIVCEYDCLLLAGCKPSWYKEAVHGMKKTWHFRIMTDRKCPICAVRAPKWWFVASCVISHILSNFLTCNCLICPELHLRLTGSPLCVEAPDFLRVLIYFSSCYLFCTTSGLIKLISIQISWLFFCFVPQSVPSLTWSLVLVLLTWFVFCILSHLTCRACRN